MIFTDADFVTQADLASLDFELPKVAQAEQITVEAICTQACQEIGNRILTKMAGFAGTLPPFVAPYSQTAAALNLVGPSVQRPRVSLSQIVTNSTFAGTASWAPIKRAAAYKTLEMFYRNAFYRKMNDRYEKRMLLFAKELRLQHWPAFFNQGCPTVNQPMVAPGAIYEPGVGVWSASNLTTVAGTNGNASTAYDVAVTWLDSRYYASPLAKGNSESAPSATASVTVATANVIRASIAGLTAPNGTTPPTIPQGQGLFTPLIASHWNVYVGVSGGTLYLQNASPIAYATKTYTLAGAPVLSGNAADQGQVATSNQTMQNLMFRG